MPVFEARILIVGKNHGEGLPQLFWGLKSSAVETKSRIIPTRSIQYAKTVTKSIQVNQCLLFYLNKYDQILEW